MNAIKRFLIDYPNFSACLTDFRQLLIVSMLKTGLGTFN